VTPSSGCRWLAGAFLACALSAPAAAQTAPKATASQPAAAAPATAPAIPPDILGRSTPRGTVLGFLTAGRKGDIAVARQFLNTTLPEPAAQELAHELFAVLDVRLPPRLTLLNDTPEGSRANPLAPDEEVVGTVEGPNGPLDVVLQRVTRGRAAPIWLFAQATLDGIAPVYDDVVQQRARLFVPRFMYESRVASLRLTEWAVMLLALTSLYLATVVLNRLLAAVVAPLWRRLFRQPQTTGRNVLPVPARLLIITIVSRWTFERLPVSLLLRQHLANLAALALIVSVAWLWILLNGAIERRLVGRVARANMAATLSLLRVARRLADALVIFLAVIVTLRHYGVDPTPVLAGLGVGGLAIALAAQRTLENVIAGASLIFDQALRVGDVLKIGEISGTVDHIGLRSTRIRTPDRTVVSVPNGQIANMSLEILSARDTFWFRPAVALRYDTTAAQLRAVIDGLQAMLASRDFVERGSVRVRFLRMAASSLDVDVSAYVNARDWSHFLELQETLLFQVMEIISAAGTGVALPSQTLYLRREGVAESA